MCCRRRTGLADKHDGRSIEASSFGYKALHDTLAFHPACKNKSVDLTCLALNSIAARASASHGQSVVVDKLPAAHFSGAFRREGRGDNANVSHNSSGCSSVSALERAP